MLYNVTPNFSLSAPSRSTGRVALPQRPSVQLDTSAAQVGGGITGRTVALHSSPNSAVNSTVRAASAAPRQLSRAQSGGGGPMDGFSGGPTGVPKPTDRSPDSVNGRGLATTLGDIVKSVVPQAQQAANTNGIIDSIAPTIANNMAKSEVDPLINELNLQIGLNGQQFGAQLVGFDAQRQNALNEYNNAMEALKISDRGRTDKRWLMDEMLKLQMRYYDRINAGLADQTGAANRQTPLLAAEKADNSRLYELKAGELGRAKEGATDDNAMKQWELDQNAAIGAGWQTKGYRIRSKTQTKEYQRTMANIEGELESARINRDANDRNLTEKEAQVQDQLAQLVRDGAANEDKRVGDYLQYLYDVSELGRGAAEDNLRARRAAQQRDYQNSMIDSAQLQASIDRQRSDSQLRNQQTQTINDSHQNALNYLGTVKAGLASSGQDQQAQRFFDWFISEGVRKGATREQALDYLASYVQAGNPLVIPAGQDMRTRGSGTWTK